MLMMRGDERCLALFEPSDDAAGLASDIDTARERWHVRPRTLAGPWVATNADGELGASIVFDHLWRDGRIELDGATIEVRHRRGFRAGYDLIFADETLLSVRRRRGLRLVATLELAASVPRFPRVSVVLAMACVFLDIADAHSGGG
jgi:hypothetical protein